MTESPRRRVALVVDDDLAALDTTSRFLVRKGFVVHTACTPIGAGTIATEESPDVVVLDLMPAMGGGSLAEILRRRGDQVPIVFYSSMALDEVRDLTRSISNSALVSKSDGPSILVAIIERLLTTEDRR